MKTIKAIDFSKKTQYLSLYKKAISLIWVPETVDLSTDKLQWPAISSEVKKSVLSMLRYAILLDSHQIEKIAAFAVEVDNVDLKALLASHASSEITHTMSYSYFAETVCSAAEKKNLYTVDKAGEERIATIEKIAKEFGPIVANYWLEAVAFQGLFRLADILRSKNILPGLSSLIQLIAAEEEIHIKTFALMMKDEDKQFCYEAFYKYAPIEGEMIAELTGIPEFKEYYVFVANFYLKALGFKTPTVLASLKSGSPFKHLWALGDHSKKKLKGNFFTSSLTYDSSRPDLDWSVDNWFKN